MTTFDWYWTYQAPDAILKIKEMVMPDFAGQIAVITGAGRGLGFAYAKLLAQRGAHVVVQDVGTGTEGDGCDPEVAERAAGRLRREGLSASAAHGRIQTREDCRRLMSSVLSAHGRLDILIHNAGWVGYQPVEQMDELFVRRMTSLGIDATLWLAHAAWPIMAQQRYGRILLTTSDRALYPEYAQKGLAAYAAAKAAVAGIANVLALEGAEHGIVVNAISPVAKTRMWGIEDEPDDLHPDAVAAGAGYLVSAACEEGGWVLRASNGQFHAIRPTEAEHVDYPRDLKAVTAKSPEQVAANWRRIAPEVKEFRA